MAYNIRPVQGERSIGELFGDLAREISTLVRQEIALARSEMTQSATHAARDIGMLVVGGLILYAGVLALVAAAILGVAVALPAWASALIIGVAVVALGGAMAWLGISALRREHLAPEQTIETVKEDAQWLKNRVS